MHIETFLLTQHDWVPNNPRLPVIFYHGAIDPKTDLDTAGTFETTFAHNGWPAQWRDGIYDYHHYHSTAHEVLGVAAGQATIIVGGPQGLELDLISGDAILLPAGTGHKCLVATPDFLVVGGYPEGQMWDICQSEPSEATRLRMTRLGFPHSDPIEGLDGILTDHWH